MTKISIFLCEWQVLFREGIHFTLCGEEDFEVIGEATNNAEALDFIEKNRPGVAILNASRGKPNAIEVAGRIKQNLSSVAIILITDNHNDEQLFSAMKSGANACLSKDMSPDELVDTIRKVAQGDYPIDKALLVPAIASRVIDEFEVSSLITEETGNLPAHLSPVERAILSHIAGGSPIEEITRALDSNEEAIWRKLDLILTKLTANDHRREVIKPSRATWLNNL